MSEAVKSAARAVEVLGYFERTRKPASLKTLCGDLGFPQSSTTALLKTLTAQCYLSYNVATRTYFPTMKVHKVGEWVPATLFGDGEIIRAVDRIHAQTNETVVIVFKNDIYVQYIVAKESNFPVRYHVEEGSMRIITTTVLGWILLAMLSDCEVDNIIRRCNLAVAKPPSSDVENILAEVSRIRERGYGYAENIHSLGGATLGIVLPNKIQGQPVVIGCGGVAERMRDNLNDYLSVLRRETSSVGGSIC